MPRIRLVERPAGSVPKPGQEVEKAPDPLPVPGTRPAMTFLRAEDERSGPDRADAPAGVPLAGTLEAAVALLEQRR